MRFKLYKEHGALNSPPIFQAVEQGLRSIGQEIVTENEDIPVIWSVLWQGRMAANKEIYHRFRKEGKPVIIIEVGNLIRGTTWRLCLNHINGLGEFGNQEDLDPGRPKKLGVSLKPLSNNRRGEILIAAQHGQSLQWEGMPPMKVWVEETIKKIKQYSSKRIIVRPHPRSLFPLSIPGVIFESPKKLQGTYDDFDIFYNYHCVINHNSGPAVQAAINGVPVICDESSLAGKLSGSIENIENISLPDREDWFLKLTHTEWTIDEIRTGLPIQRILSKLC